MSEIELESIIMEQRRENLAVCETQVKSLSMALGEMEELNVLENSERKIEELRKKNSKCLESWYETQMNNVEMWEEDDTLGCKIVHNTFTCKRKKKMLFGIIMMVWCKGKEECEDFLEF